MYHRNLLSPTLTLCFLVLSGCGSSAERDDGDREEPAPSTSYSLYKTENNRWADAMAECLPYENGVLRECPSERLPLLGSLGQTPSSDDVLSRLYVSEDWMQERFKKVLEIVPVEFYSMARSVRAFVIGDFYASHYNPKTSVIHLDEREFCHESDEQFANASNKDPRMERMRELKFSFGTMLYRGESKIPKECAESSFDDMLHRAIFVLMHETTHAVDYYPDGSMDAHEFVFEQNPVAKLSSQLAPLPENTIGELVGTIQNGGELSSELRALEAGNFAKQLEKANLSIYSFANSLEHFAELVTVATTRKYFGLRLVTAVNKKPAGELPQSKNTQPDYIIFPDSDKAPMKEMIEQALQLALPESGK